MLEAAIRKAGPKPRDDAGREKQKNYAQKLSEEVARAVAAELRRRGLRQCEPREGGRGERRFAGALGAKKVDVSVATEDGGLLLGVSIKSINFPDKKTKNFQKNLTNRRNDLLAEAMTLHKRFPYAVLGGLFLMDERAASDATGKRRPTADTAHRLLGLFGNRAQPTNAHESFEALGIVLYKADRKQPQYKYFRAGHPSEPVSISTFFDELLQRLEERNPEHYEYSAGRISRRGRTSREPLPSDEDEEEEEGEGET